MKTRKIITAIIPFILFILPFMATGQKVVKDIETEPFTGVSAGDVFNVYLKQADDFSLIIEAEEEHLEEVSINVRRNVLTLTYDGGLFRRAGRISAYISAPTFETINASGAAAISSEEIIITEHIDVVASGASNVNLDIETDKLITKASGTANVTLGGYASLHESELSGAASLKAYGLQTEKSDVKGSGASSLQINASESLRANASGTSSINFQQVPKEHSFNTSGAGSINYKGDASDMEDISLRIDDKKDTLRVKLGERDLMIISDEDASKQRVVKRKRSFRKNWSGLDVGINGYLTPDHSISLDDDYYYLDLDYARSISVAFNLFQQNVNLIGNNLGLVTGAGFSFNNYAFENNIMLTHSRDSIGYETREDFSFRRNRLSLIHFNVPLLLEFQTSSTNKIEQFHLSVGVIGGAKLRSYTRQVYDYDGDRHKEKIRGSYHTRPFNLDATARIGWGRVNLFATYSLYTLFRDDKAPELYPINVGISFN